VTEIQALTRHLRHLLVPGSVQWRAVAEWMNAAIEDEGLSKDVTVAQGMLCQLSICYVHNFMLELNAKDPWQDSAGRHDMNPGSFDLDLVGMRTYGG